MRTFHKNKKSKHGFTLIEILITISLLGLIAGVASPMVLKSKYNKEIKEDAIKIDTLIQKAKNLAITGSTTASAGGVPTYGYGVNFGSGNKVTLFTNTLDGDEYEYTPNENYGTEDEGDIVTLNESVGIDYFSTDLAGYTIPSSQGANIIFLPPAGSIEINDNNNDGIAANSFNDEMSIFLRHEYSSKCYEFFVNKITSRYYRSIDTCP